MPEAMATAGLRHAVFFYQGIADYRAAVATFVRTGLGRKEPVLLAVPRPGSALPDWAATDAELVTVADMADICRNPARLIQTLRTFADRYRGRRARIVTEAVWPGRPAAEICEAARTDALIDRALDGIDAALMCPYDTAGLTETALADAARAHQWQLGADAADSVAPSPQYAGPDATPVACRLPLPDPPPDATTIRYRADLRPVRALVTAACARAGLSAMRSTDMTLAMSELAANTLQHTQADGVAQTWQRDGELLCQVTDSGFIANPLAGLLQPQPDQPGGHGLWLVNQVCDLVEIRTSAFGTAIRLHMRINR